ncbi:uncharacterized protein LOC133068208 [Dama dama]|uniref:uncharacterized protein LOC133068208 n=1 Tax=Dama dama TaxID=30532 RepID=UPI002A36285A|nr:uncharacterized protein LOC133068208 [Dama dama]
MWGTPQKKAEATLKQALTQAPALRLPDPKKAFHEREGIALGALTQRLGSEPQPVAYLSKRLDPTAQGWPPSPTFKYLAAIAIMIEDALKLSFGGKLTIFTSHQVKQLLNGRGHLRMSDQRILRYQVILMENPGLTIPPCEVLNPATLLPTPEGSLPFHSCLETLDHWTKPREGLSEDALINPEEIWYTDGSIFVLDGKRRAGYAVVSNFEIIEAKPLLPAVKVPGHDSWIHYSRVKPWKKTEEDTQYTCEPLGDLRYRFRTTNECHSNKQPQNLVSGDKISQDSSKEPTQLCRSNTPKQTGDSSSDL